MMEGPEPGGHLRAIARMPILDRVKAHNGHSLPKRKRADVVYRRRNQQPLDALFPESAGDAKIVGDAHYPAMVVADDGAHHINRFRDASNQVRNGYYQLHWAPPVT